MQSLNSWRTAAAALVLAGFHLASSAASPVVGAYVINERSEAVVDALAPGRVTHLLYAFLHLCGPGVRPEDVAGCKAQPDFSIAPNEAHARFHTAFERLKARDPKVQVLASLGGWGGSDPFFHLAATSAGRAALVHTGLDFLRENPGFDGLDIDWEHPGNNGAANGVQLGSPADGAHYVALMRELRAGLDGLTRETGRRYLLSAAINASRTQMQRMPMGEAAKSMDLVFLMSYDFYGPWSTHAGHHAALRSSARGDDSLAAAVANLRSAGVPAAKLVGGVAMYARGFEGVTPDGRYSGLYPAPKGEITYRELGTLAGLKPVFDKRTQSWALVGDRGRFVGYDDPRAVRAKRRFAVQQGLAGLFAWELSQDNGEILDAMQQ
jgi:chitinase